MAGAPCLLHSDHAVCASWLIHANSDNKFHGRSPLFEICNDLILAHRLPSGPSTPTGRTGFGSAATIGPKWFTQRRTGNQDPAFRQQIFDVAEAQREPNIEPNRVLDDFGRKAIAAMPPTAVCD